MLSSLVKFYSFYNIIVLIVISSVIYLLKLCYDHIRLIVMLSKFPGPKRSLILGDMMDLIQTTDILHLTLRKWARELYPHYTIRLFHHMSLQVISPEDCEIFLGSKKHSSKSEIYSLLKNWLRDGLLLSEGRKWTKRRRILTPAFHFSVLKNFISIFNEETDRIIEIVSNKCSEPIDVLPIGYDFSLNTVNETSMGHKLDTNNKNQKGYMEAIYKTEDLLLKRLMRPWLYNNYIWLLSPDGREESRLLEVLHSFTKKVINERRRTFDGISPSDQSDSDDDTYMNKKRRKLAMLDILLQAELDGEDIDYEGICEEVDTFMFEGHDTTGAAIGFCLMLIANHQDIQAQILDEIISVLGEDKRKPNYNDLHKMDLLERCIKESLRLYPSVHFISRRVDEDVVLNSGLVCPKNAIVLIHIFDVHRNPEIYPDPEKFDPDRFLPENCQRRHPYAYIPFSAGPRNCIGQKFAISEMKALIVGILQNFKLLPVDTPESVTLKLEIILRTVNKIKVKFVPR